MMSKRLPYIILVIGFVGLFFSIYYFVSNLGEQKQEEVVDAQDLTRVEVNTGEVTWVSTTPQLVNSGVVNSGVSISAPKSKEIVIMMPGYFFVDDFIAMGQKIYEKYGVRVVYQSVEDMAAYKKILQETSGTGFASVDLFLVPTDWLMSLENGQLKSVSSREDVFAFVHTIFLPYANQKYSFVPHVIDPLVTFVAKDTNLSVQQLSMSKILSYLSIGEVNKSLSLPVLWGVSKNDVRLLEIGKESFPNYFGVLYQLLYQYKGANNLKELDAMLRLSTLESEYARDYVRFVEILKRIEKRNAQCVNYPDVCMFAYKFADIKFGYLSDLVVWNKYFADANRGLGDVDIAQFPVVSSVYKVRGWGFAVNAQSDADERIDIFVSEYLKAGVDNSFSLWDNVWSAHNAVFDFQKTQEKYRYLLPFEAQFSLIHNGWDLQERFLKQTQTLDLLKGKIGVKEYLDALDWVW